MTPYELALRDAQHQMELFPVWVGWLSVLAVVFLIWFFGGPPSTGKPQ